MNLIDRWLSHIFELVETKYSQNNPSAARNTQDSLAKIPQFTSLELPEIYSIALSEGLKRAETNPFDRLNYIRFVEYLAARGYTIPTDHMNKYESFVKN